MPLELFTVKYDDINNNQELNIEEITVGSSMGDQKKWIFTDKDCTYYWKANSVECYEAEAEVIVSELGNLLGFPILRYTLEHEKCIDNKYYTICSSKDYSVGYNAYSVVELIPDIAKYKELDKWNKTLEGLNFIEDSKQQLTYILLLDYIFNNNDRHLRNIEILIDKDNNAIFSPIFDNGAALFSKSKLDTLKNELKCSHSYKSRPFMNTFGRQLELVDFSLLCLTPLDKITVYKTVNKYLQKERATLIGKFIIERLKDIDLLKED